MGEEDIYKRLEVWLLAQSSAPRLRWRVNMADTLHRQRGERMVKEALAAGQGEDDVISADAWLKVPEQSAEVALRHWHPKKASE